MQASPLQAWRGPLPRALNPDLDFRQLEQDYIHGTPPLIYFDHFLVPEALQGLIDFCNEATVFYDVREGYLGAYLNEGLSSPLLLQIIRELREQFPIAIGQQVLGNAWAYKCVCVSRGG